MFQGADKILLHIDKILIKENKICYIKVVITPGFKLNR